MMTSEGEVVRTGHSACSVSTLDNLTDEDMTKYTVKVSTWSRDVIASKMFPRPEE